MEFFIIVWFLLLCAIFSGAIAYFKNRSFLGWFLIGLLLGPFGLLVAFFRQIEPGASSAEKSSPPQGIEFENYCRNKAANAKAKTTAVTESKPKSPEPNGRFCS